MSEEKVLLKELIHEVRETKSMVNAMNKQRRWGNFFWVLKWILIAGVLYSAWLAATPYIETYNQAVDNINSFSGMVNKSTTTESESFTGYLRDNIKKWLVQ